MVKHVPGKLLLQTVCGIRHMRVSFVVHQRKISTQYPTSMSVQKLYRRHHLAVAGEEILADIFAQKNDVNVSDQEVTPAGYDSHTHNLPSLAPFRFLPFAASFCAMWETYFLEEPNTFVLIDRSLPLVPHI